MRISIISMAFASSHVAFGQSQNVRSYYVYAEPLPSWAEDYASNAVFAATKAWEDANPNIKFYKASSAEQADLYVQWIRDYGSTYAGETIGGRVVQIGLGNSYCMGKWFPFSTETVNLIATHEIGHFLGLGHSSDPNSVMYATAKFRYGIVEVQDSLGPNYSWFVPVCTLDNVTTYNYQVKTDDPTYGFDVYFVPSKAEYDHAIAGESSSHYSDSACYGENYLSYGGTCKGVSKESGLYIKTHATLTNALARITVRLLEIPSSESYNVPVAQTQSAPLQQPSQNPPPPSNSYAFVNVEGTEYSLLTNTIGGTVSSISVNPSHTSLVVLLTASSDGTLTLRQPRALIDAKGNNGSDAEFVALVGGNPAYFVEDSKDDVYRTLTIHFSRGTNTIEIVGTRVVPEFQLQIIIILMISMGIGVIFGRMKHFSTNCFR